MSFWTYMLHCRGGFFYVGHTDDLDRRMAEHTSGTARGFASDHLPVEIVWSEAFPTRYEAPSMERRLKGWSRAKKMALIRGDWGGISRLAAGKRQGRPSTGSGRTELAGRLPLTTRFAPSPTGRLHLGHAFSAMLAHDVARASGGRFLLRIEDIDGTRSRAEYIAGIEADLTWLGLAWDGPALRQSTRLSTYAEALEGLKARNLLYPCFCTRADIAAALSAPHGPAGPVYPGTCRALSNPPLDRPHAWRLDMARAVAVAGRLTLEESGCAITADPAAHGDVVLARKDAPASYHLAATLDDAFQGVTDVIRGDDLLPATHVHRLLQALLDLPSPRYRHHPLLADAAGRRLAKRDGATALADLRVAGADPVALLAQLRLAQPSLATRAERSIFRP